MFKRIFIILIVIIGAIAAAVFLLKGPKKPEYVTQRVERAQLRQTVDATGKIESAERIELNFKGTGRIEEILVDTGQEVKTGQRLASLETGALQSKVADAEAQLKQAEANYEKLLAGASDEDINVIESTVRQKEQDVKNARNNLRNIKNVRDIELGNLKDAVITAMNNELRTSEGAIVEIDNTLSDEDARKTLSAEDSDALTRALASETDANNAINDIEATLATLDTLSSDEAVREAVNETKLMLAATATALSDTLDVLLATTKSDDLTESELDSLKTNIIAKQNKINSSLSNIQSVNANWTDKIAYYSDQVTSGEDAILAAQRALDVSKSQLALKKSPPRQFDIDAALASIEKAKAALSLARANLSDLVIYAPINGTIVKKNYDIGEQTKSSLPVFEMIGESALQIEADIPESDIAKVKVGQKAIVTFDAFSDEEVFDATVTFVDPAETVIQDVVYYQVKMQIDNGNERIKPGMTANVTIVTEVENDVLVVPSRAIKTQNGKKYAEVLQNGVVIKKIVRTGTRGDQGVEIIEGLKEGDIVVTFVKEE